MPTLALRMIRLYPATEATCALQERIKSKLKRDLKSKLELQPYKSITAEPKQEQTEDNEQEEQEKPRCFEPIETKSSHIMDEKEAKLEEAQRLERFRQTGIFLRQISDEFVKYVSNQLTRLKSLKSLLIPL